MSFIFLANGGSELPPSAHQNLHLNLHRPIRTSIFVSDRSRSDSYWATKVMCASVAAPCGFLAGWATFTLPPPCSSRALVAGGVRGGLAPPAFPHTSGGSQDRRFWSPPLLVS
jgi:hypothetical protein